jgi:acetyl-CoA carboxylase carboxyl transferase subunit beta
MATAQPEPLLDELRALPGGTPGADPLQWPGYRDDLARARERSGRDESVVAGHASVGATPVVLVDFEFAFLGGSMGSVTGGRLVAAIDEAARSRRPLVSYVASGGARMQEGVCALIQMQRIAAAVARLRRAGVPHVCVVRHPTTGGVWASFASTADVLIGIRGATVCFAGPRVRGAGAEDQESFRTAGKVRCGYVDVEVEADDLPETLERYVALLAAGMAAPPRLPDPPRALGVAPAGDSAWDAVEAARDPARPRAGAYLDDYFDERAEISGDRVGGTDHGMRCGIGRRGDEVVAYAAQTGSANTPAGFRTARRLVELAERLGLPVLTLIDTPGAANDAEAERAGVGPAIAELFVAMASVTVPVRSVVIGEGGSGGALALAGHDGLSATPDSYFAVMAPEGVAAILHRDATRAREIAPLMCLRPHDLQRLGIVSQIL